MKKYVKIYIDSMGYDTSDVIPCEICGAVAVDIMHIFPKGSGGSYIMDFVENLAAGCRRCHEKYGDKEHLRRHVVERHEEAMQIRGYTYRKWLIDLMKVSNKSRIVKAITDNG